jgi:molecular chaperone DnaK (HSP70)
LTEHPDRIPVAHPVIGIDFGTTSCTVSYWDGSQVVVLPPIPAVVRQDPAGRVVVGRPSAVDADGAVPGIKRRLGDSGRVRLRSHEYPLQETVAFLLIELKRRAEAAIGAPVHDAVITVPGSSGDRERRTLREAAGLAQLNPRCLLDEPAAAAVAFGTTEPPGTYAIFDLGGGTFDVAIVRIGHDRPPHLAHSPPPGHRCGTTAGSPGPAGAAVRVVPEVATAVLEKRTGVSVTVLGSCGNPRLGGDDFDERIVDHVLRQIRERHHVDLGSDGSIRRRIGYEAERRKRELSTAVTTVLELPQLTATVSASIPLTRHAFETMIESDLATTFGCLATALTAAGLAPVDLDQVLLTGGSTRIPAIRTRLAAFLGLPLTDIRADLDPEGSIARGAALVALDYAPTSFDGTQPGLLSTNLRLRAEMTAPEAEIPSRVVPDEPGTPGALPEPPAETPADFRPAAESAFALLTVAPGDARPALRASYLALVAAIHAAAPDAELAGLGAVLSTSLAQAR